VLYHLLWELTHVLLEESERLAPDDGSELSDFGSLYPFLAADRKAGDPLHADLCASGVAKLRALSRLRDESVRTHGASLASCAASLRCVFAAGGELLVFGNGGSQTDADWIATGLAAHRPVSSWRVRSLANDPSVMSALANDVGFERVFARQVAAFGRPGDAALGISTSGSSGNVVDGLAEAKRKGLVTIGLAGGGGGRMVHESDLDFLYVVASDSVHRIQEVQATLYHLLAALSASGAQAGGSECDS
jgi:D-sedoheptulose 7-phosphate isomerase